MVWDIGYNIVFTTEGLKDMGSIHYYTYSNTEWKMMSGLESEAQQLRVIPT